MPVDASNTHTVVAHGPDRARDMRAVAVVVHWVGVVVGEVPAVHIVHIAIAVVVDTVAGHFARIVPRIGSQIGMGVVDARIDHGDNDSAGTGGCVPRFWGIDIGIGHAARLPNIIEAPELAECGVVGGDCGSDDKVWLNRGHTNGASSPVHNVLHAGSRRCQRIKTLAKRGGLPVCCQIERRGRHQRSRCRVNDPAVGSSFHRVAVPLDLLVVLRCQPQIGREADASFQRLQRQA